MHVVQEHVGKKRRKEVRQAINMSNEKKRLLRYCIGMLAIGCALVLLFIFFSFTQIIPVSPFLRSIGPILIFFAFMMIITPKANRYWTLRETCKTHCERYNITKADMQALKNDEM